MKPIYSRLLTAALVAALPLALATPALAGKGNDPINTSDFSQGTTTTTTCVKEKGTWVCSTTEEPGKNQGGVGTSSGQNTQGNLTNTSPEPQVEPQPEDSCNPPSSNGKPCNP